MTTAPAAMHRPATRISVSLEKRPRRCWVAAAPLTAPIPKAAILNAFIRCCGVEFGRRIRP